MPFTPQKVLRSPTVTVSAPAYSSGDCIGGIIEITNAIQAGVGGAILDCLTVVDANNQKAVLEVLLFDATPAGGTYTDNGALALSAADLTHLLAVIPVAAADYFTTGSIAVATVKNLAVILAAAVGVTSLFCLIKTTGTPTYSAGATAFVPRFGLEN